MGSQGSGQVVRIRQRSIFMMIFGDVDTGRYLVEGRRTICNEGRINVLPSHPLVRAVSIPSGVWCCIVLHTRGMRGTLPESPVLPP